MAGNEDAGREERWWRWGCGEGRGILLPEYVRVWLLCGCWNDGIWFWRLGKSKGLVLSRRESRDCCAGSPVPPVKCQATFVLGELRVPVSVHPIAVVLPLVSRFNPGKCVTYVDLGRRPLEVI